MQHNHICEHRMPSKYNINVDKIRYVKCKMAAPRFYYFDGMSLIALCDMHAKEYESLNLTIKEHK